jgi:pyruvate formate lyase activating enzyme
MTATLEKSGRILHLQRLSTEDGPGIRTTVFFKGCPLQCAWCHNPESISGEFQVQWFADRCLGCETCLSTCLEGALHRQGNRLIILRENCTGCGACATACPANALEILGKYSEINDLVAELVKDRVYYEKSGGGVTLSGGEPGAQPEFAMGLLITLRQAGIHTALDTCGLMSTGVLTQFLSLTDQLLFDVKTINESKHQQFTGQSNRLILSNLLIAGDYIRAHAGNPKLWIRTPLIPGSTATDGNILDIGHFLAENMKDCITRWELCAFNNLCRDKYARLDLEWQYTSEPLFTRNDLDQFEKIARSCGLDPGRVLVTGAARFDDCEKKG